MLLPNEQSQWVRLASAGNTLVKTGQGLANGFLVASGTPTVTIYDGTSASGKLLLDPMVCAPGTPYPLAGAQFNVGCFVVMSGAGAVTFFYN